MRVLVGTELLEDVLDDYRGPNEFRIRVDGLCNLERIEDMYFVRPNSWRLLWNYVSEIGAREVWRKVVSRRRERRRNVKYVSVGYGTILEAPDAQRISEGNPVIFVAPSHPACMERIVLPSELVRPVDASILPDVDASAVRYCPQYFAPTQEAAWWRDARAWSIHSGRELADTDAILDAAVDAVRSIDWEAGLRMTRNMSTPVREYRTAKRTGRSVKPTATLVGYGNYAKTVIIPNLRDHVRVQRIHEIDPLQIPPDDWSVTWDTAPLPRPDDESDVILVAGFHHTHAPIAVQALARGRYAVVEKPVATDASQAGELVAAVRREQKFFACFHKRYLPFNDYARDDLRIDVGDPISYHCIVYEVPLPALHWYRWPNSRSRLVSNGCHWLDHFLFLNDFAKVECADLTLAPDGTINCSVTLANGAFFTMVLTDRGSERIGVQDYIELRANDTTVRMINGTRYEAEGPDRILRRARINRMRSYQEMYRTIGRKIVRGEPGDSLASVEVSASLVLQMEAKLNELLRLDVAAHPIA